jgi:trk system potassium uptake protein TrkH
MATRWQVSGVVAGLIVLGGLGFAVQYNLLLVVRARLNSPRGRFRPQTPPARLALTSRLVLLTTASLLVGGMIGYFLLESDPGPNDGGTLEQVCNAWFQSVTYRTAGFHTVDHAELQPATKLFAVVLMFIGASPGSTGGGIKTVCFALGILAVISILRGRPRVEIAGRTVPDFIVNRALAIIALGMAAMMATTLLLVVFEARQDRFLSHLYEAASALGTVGVSTGITPELTAPSKLVLIGVMFLGRVGPLTLLLALAGRASDASFEYPTERVTLG